MSKDNGADELFFRLQLQLNRNDINKVSGNLKTHELGILHIINNHQDKGGVYVSEIAKPMGLSMSAVSRILKRLEDELHFIERKSDPNDRRNILVSLTEIGKNEYSKRIKAAIEFSKRVFNYLTPEEQELFIQFSERLAKAADIEMAKLSKKEINERSV